MMDRPDFVALKPLKTLEAGDYIEWYRAYSQELEKYSDYLEERIKTIKKKSYYKPKTI
jgi:hypothetical protein